MTPTRLAATLLTPIRHRYRCTALLTPFMFLAVWAMPLISAAQMVRSFTEPFERVEVSAAEAGVLAHLHVREGRMVKQGETLAELDNEVLTQSRRLAEQRVQSTARIDAARADVKLKQKMYDSLTPLLQEGHANPSEVDRAQSELEQVLAALRLAEDQAAEDCIELDRINAQLSRRSVRSPIDGIVIEIHRRPGEYVSINDPRLVTIVQLHKLRCRFFVITEVAESLSAGDEVSVVVRQQQQSVRALVEYVSPITDADSGTVRMDVLIDNSENEHRCGVCCEIVTARGRPLPSASAWPTGTPSATLENQGLAEQPGLGLRKAQGN